MTSDNILLQKVDADGPEVEINLREYWMLIQRHRYRILGFGAVLTILAAMVLFSLPSIYEAGSTILIESKEAQVVSIEEVYDLGTGKSEYLQTQFEVLKSQSLAEKTIHALGLMEKYTERQARNDKGFTLPFFQSEPDTEDRTLERTKAWFVENLDVRPIRNTQLVKISFRSEDPVLSAEIINKLAIIYIENDLEARLDMTRHAATWLNSRLVGLRDNLEKAEQDLQAYREKENLVDAEGVKSIASRELNELTTKLVEARRARTEAENIVNQASRDTGSIPAVLQHSLVQKLKEQEAIAEQKLSELSKRYGPKHPKILAIKEELIAARGSTGHQVGRVIDGVRREYQIAKATEDALTREMDDLKSNMQGINRKEYKLNELERAVEINRQLYDTFFSRIKETSETSDLQTAHARVIDRAIVPSDPVAPRRGMLLLVSATLSILLGIVLAFIKEMLDDTVRNPDDVRNRLGEQLLGVLPLLKDKRERSEAASVFIKDSRGTFSESIRTIRTGVVLSGLDNPHKVLVVTSSVPGEGKTVIASNLAVAFGQMGKVLLIDADMRRPSVAKSFGLPLSAPGLSNLVAETTEARLCIHHMEALGIDIIPAGLVPPNPLELLSSKRFSTALAALEKHYDRIIIDSAPCEVVSDALVLSTFANALIYVVKSDVTQMKAIRSGISRLRNAGAPITGVVLNQVDVQKGSRYGGYYYGGYYDQYGYTSDSKKST
jgi:succinoglycan biosynthesis transport protein ExoP